METIMSVLIGVFFAIGTYMVLSKSLLRIILGTSVIGHAVNLLILTMGRLKSGGPPLLDIGNISYTDGLPQALVLTAIVINFAVTGLFLVLAYRSYLVLGTDDMEQLRGNDDE